MGQLRPVPAKVFIDLLISFHAAHPAGEDSNDPSYQADQEKGSILSRGIQQNAVTTDAVNMIESNLSYCYEELEFHHPDWLSLPDVKTCLISKLADLQENPPSSIDAINAGQRSVIGLAAQDRDPAVQAAVKDTIDKATANSATPAAFLYQICEVIARGNKVVPSLHDLLPEVMAALANCNSTQVPGLNGGFDDVNEMTARLLGNEILPRNPLLLRNTDFVTNAKAILEKAVNAQPNYNGFALPLAMLGDKTAFGDTLERYFQASDSLPGVQQNDTHEKSTIEKELIASVVYSGSEDKIQYLKEHYQDAVYENGQWRLGDAVNSPAVTTPPLIQSNPAVATNITPSKDDARTLLDQTASSLIIKYAAAYSPSIGRQSEIYQTALNNLTKAKTQDLLDLLNELDTQKASLRSEGAPDASALSILNIKYDLLSRALDMTTTENDLPALLASDQSKALRLAFDHPSWCNDPPSTALMLKKLDEIASSAPSVYHGLNEVNVLEVIGLNRDPAVQDKFKTCLLNGLHNPNSPLSYLMSITDAVRTSTAPAIQALDSEAVKALDDVDDEKVKATAQWGNGFEYIECITQLILERKGLSLDAATRDETLRRIKLYAPSGDTMATSRIAQAKLGDKDAFQALINSYVNSSDTSDVTILPLLQNVKDHLIPSVVCHGEGDPTSILKEHVTEAVYQNGQWIITLPGYTPETASIPAIAPPSPPPPSGTSGAVASGNPSPAPAIISMSNPPPPAIGTPSAEEANLYQAMTAYNSAASSDDVKAKAAFQLGQYFGKKPNLKSEDFSTTIQFFLASARLGDADALAGLQQVIEAKRGWNRVRAMTDLYNYLDWAEDNNALSPTDHPVLQKIMSALARNLGVLSGHSAPVISCAFSPDGHFLASTSEDKSVKIWDMNSGSCVRTLTDDPNGTTCLAFSQDGKLLAGGGNDHAIRLWDSGTGHCLQTLQGHTDTVLGVAFSRDGNLLASGSADTTIKIWDVHAGTCQSTLTGHGGPVNGVSFSPTGRILASGSDDHTVRLWSVQTWECTETLTDYDAPVTSVQWCPQGNNDLQILAIGSQDGNTRILKIGSYTYDDHLALTKPQTLKGDGSVLALSWNSDGRLLAIRRASSGVQIWHPQSGDLLVEVPLSPPTGGGVSLSPDGTCVAAGVETNQIGLWYAYSFASEPGQTLTGNKAVTGRWAAFSPDGKTLACASEDNTVQLWDIPTATLKTTLTGHTAFIRAIAWTPDGQKLISVGADQVILTWDPKTGQCLNSTTAHPTPENHSGFSSNAISSDLQFLAAESTGHSIEVWNIAQQQAVSNLVGGAGTVHSMAFSPDGKQLAAGQGDATVKIWDVSSGNLQYTLMHGPSGGGTVWCVKWSPDGSCLASGGVDGNIKIWDAATGECKATLVGHQALVSRIAFSSDGKLLASISEDGSLKLWDMETNSLKATLTPPGGVFHAVGVVFSPDNKILVAACWDKSPRLWRLQSILEHAADEAPNPDPTTR